MSAPGVPPWGCPWHGQVKGGRLYLPNGTSMTYPQPEATSYFGAGGVTVRPQDTYGITHRHAAGLPAIERSAEDLAADAATGRQWRNEATLSGGRLQVHAKLLNGWVYIDPDGARWLVRCTQLQDEPAVSFTSPLSVTVQLIRFGVLGGAAESYSYSVSLPFGDTGGYSNGSLLLDAISPTGNAAVVMAFRRITAGRYNRDPVNFIEITISGPGATALIAAAVVRDFSLVDQVTAKLPSKMWWKSGSVWYEEDPGVFDVRSHECVESGPRTFSRIIALWYDTAGQLQDVLFRVQGAFDVNSSRLVMTETGTLVLPFSADSGMTGTAQIVVGGVVQSTISLSANLAVEWNGLTAAYTHNLSVGGVDLAGSSEITETYWEQAPFPDIALLIVLTATGTGYTPFVLGMGSYQEPGDPDAIAYRATLGLYWYSRQVVGFELSTELGAGTNPASRTWRNLPPVTPTGLASGTTQLRTIATAPIYYGSHDPYTGDVAWYQPSPVCYV